MSPRVQLALFGLVTLPLAALTALALASRPGLPMTPTTTGGRSVPRVGVWYVVCPPDGWRRGPFGSPDVCRTRLESLRERCTRPLRVDGTVNPDFFEIASVCRDAYNATHCGCDYQLAVARAPLPTTAAWLRP